MWKAILGKLALVLLLTGSAFAQFGSHDVLYVASAPAGACLPGSRLQVVISTGIVYSCQSSVWASLGGGGGGTIGGSATVGSLPIMVTNTTTIGTSNESEAGGFLVIGTSNGFKLPSGPTQMSGKVQPGTTVTVPLDFSLFLGSDNSFRCQLASSALCLTPTSLGYGVSGNGVNFQTTNASVSTSGDVATYDGNGNTQDSGTLLSSLAPLTSGITIAGTLVALNGSTSSFPNPGTIGGTTPGIGDFSAINGGVLNTTAFVLKGYGSTSGSATITWPAVAGTTSNPLVFSNAINAPSSSTGTAPVACGTALGCYAATEGTASNMTITASQDAFAADATAHAFKMTLNGGAIFLSAMNASLAPTGTIAGSFASGPAGSKCVQTSGAAGLLVEAAGACGSSTPSLDQVTGSAAQATATETAIGHEYTYAGVETGNLTSPITFKNTNSTNNQTSIGLLVGAAGTSTGGIGEVVFDVSGTGDIERWYSGGSVSNGVYTIGTLEGNLSATGALTVKSIPSAGAIGGTTPSTGAFTTLTGTSSITLGANGGTGGSVVINGSTSGSATINASATGVLALPSGTTVTNLSATTPALGAATATSLLATGIVDGTAPITITTGTTANLGSTYNSGYTFNQEGTAGTGVTYTLPATAVGKQYCVQNSGTTGVVNIGVLTVYPPSSSFVILNGVVNTVGGGGTHGVASAGAAGDGACFVAIDATHWEVFPLKGTWTAN